MYSDQLLSNSLSSTDQTPEHLLSSFSNSRLSRPIRGVNLSLSKPKDPKLSIETDLSPQGNRFFGASYSTDENG